MKYLPNNVVEFEDQITAADVEELREKGIARLSLRGEAASNLVSLKCENSINKIYIRGASKIDWCSLYDLKNIVGLFVDELPDSFVDFYQFKNARILQLVVGSKANEFDLKSDSLMEVQVQKWPHKDLSKIDCCQNLTALSLRRARTLEALSGISKNSNIEFIELDGLPKLKNIEELADLKNLEYLVVNNCPVADMGKEFSLLKSLVEFSFKGIIESIGFLRGMSRLKRLRLDANIRSGDMSPILDCHNLEQVFFTNRKNQSHTLKEVHRHLEENGFVQQGARQEYKRMKMGLG